MTYQGVRYPDFVSATHYGSGDGLCGWNCRHDFWPFWPGLSTPNHTNAELEALNAKTVEYNGQMYSEYEISQMQRAAERKVRAAKRTYLAEDAAGVDTSASAVKLKQARQQLAQFIQDTGAYPFDSSARTSVAGFGRSEAGKAAWAARKNTLTNAAGQTILKVNEVSLTGTPNSITQKTNGRGGIDRNYYGPDGKQTKQISNNGHGHKKEEAMGNHGEHAHDYIYGDNGKLLDRPSRELSNAEREENGDIL
jgi:hypothetical protein